jgi:hypothetical protein
VDYYYTQLIGNPNNPPTLKATAGFSGFGLIDGDVYYTPNLNWMLVLTGKSEYSVLLTKLDRRMYSADK